jgi:hypothetical protein
MNWTCDGSLRPAQKSNIFRSCVPVVSSLCSSFVFFFFCVSCCFFCVLLLFFFYLVVVLFVLSIVFFCFFLFFTLFLYLSRFQTLELEVQIQGVEVAILAWTFKSKVCKSKSRMCTSKSRRTWFLSSWVHNHACASKGKPYKGKPYNRKAV